MNTKQPRFRHFQFRRVRLDRAIQLSLFRFTLYQTETCSESAASSGTALASIDVTAVSAQPAPVNPTPTPVNLLTVLVTDASGNPVAGVPVNWVETTNTQAARINPGGTSGPTNSNGIATAQAVAATPNGSTGYASSTFVASIQAPTGGTLSSGPFYLSTFTRVGTSPTPYSSVTALPVITVKANSTTASAIQEYFQYQVGNADGVRIFNTGFRIYTSAYNPADAFPSAVCENGLVNDLDGTVLSGSDGNATCNLRVGSVTGEAVLHVHSYGSNDIDTYRLIVQ